jgi:hypothetical protein
VTQPLNRTARLPELGALDRDGGEIWVENPFDIPNSGINLSAYERNRVYLNLRGTGFIEASFATGADIDSDSRSVVAADFDRDGAPDLLVGSVGGGPLRLFRNRFSPASHAVRIELVGLESNRPAIGARVVAHAGGRQIVRDLFPENGSLAQGPPELLIGLGESTIIDRLTVRWPTGKLQEFRNVPADSKVTITEGQPKFEVVGAFGAKTESAD